MKKLTLLLSLLCLSVFSQDKKISQLNALPSVSGSELIPVAKSGANYYTTPLQMLAYFAANTPLNNGLIWIGDASNLPVGHLPSLSATPGTFTLSNIGVFTFPNATTSLRGLLSSTDWNTFNNKIGGSGTTNYLPKFTGGSTIGNSQIFDDGSGIGINTNSPTEALHIGAGHYTGGIKFDDSQANINFTGGSGSGIIKNTSTNGWIKVYGVNSIGDLSATDGNDFRQFTDGAGTVGKGYYLKAHRDASGGGNDWPAVLKTLNAVSGGSYPKLILQDEGGNVGITKSSPAAKLDVYYDGVNNTGGFIVGNLTNSGASGVWAGAFAAAVNGDGVVVAPSGSDLNTSTTWRAQMALNGGIGEVNLLDASGVKNVHITANTAQNSYIDVGAGAGFGIGTNSPIGTLHTYNSGTIPKLIIGNPSGTDNWHYVNSVPGSYAWLDMLEGDMTTSTNYRIVHGVNSGGIWEEYYNGSANLRLRFSSISSENRFNIYDNSNNEVFDITQYGKTTVNDSLVYNYGTLGAGKVLTDISGNGVATWVAPSTTATPTGSAGGDLTGTYPNPTLTASQTHITSATNLVSVGTLTTGTWNATAIGTAYLPASQTQLTTATNLTSVGTVTTGTWNGTKIGLAYGGTNTDLSAGGAVGDIIQGATSTTFSRLAAGAAGTFLRSTGTGSLTAWSTMTLPNTISSASIPYATSANTIGESNRLYFNVNGLNVDNTASGTSPTLQTSCNTTSSANVYGGFNTIVSDNATGTDKVLMQLSTRTASSAPVGGMGGYIDFQLFKHANTGFFESGRMGTRWTNSSDNGQMYFATGASGTVATIMSLSSTGMYVGSQTNTATVSTKILDVNGDVSLIAAGNGFYIKEGTNATMGVATLSSGTVTVSTTKVTANSRIFITIQGGTLTNVGSTYVSARSAGTSFTITSTNILDASNVAWIILEPGP